MADFPRSLIEFQRSFPDERACAAYLARVRWPDGFRCPACGRGKGWELSTKTFTWECASCGKQTSVTAGTVMHGSKLELTVWFWAAYLMATHSNGMSARQLWRQLGLGSYKSAWLLCAKLRRAMVAPDRSPLQGVVEVDETTIPYRRNDDPPAGGQDAATRAGCWLPAPSRSKAEHLAAFVWRRSPTARPKPCTPSFAATSPRAPPSRPTAGRAMPAHPTSATRRMSSDPWPPISSFPGRIASSPTSKAGRSASTRACAANTCNPTSTNSCSASIAAKPATPPSVRCSPSASQPNTPPTTC